MTDRVVSPLAWLSALAGLLLVIGLACGPAAPPSPTPAPVNAPGKDKPAETSLKLGLPVHSSGFLPIYLAAERTFREEGLAVEVLAFNGGAAVAQALAADSLDVGLISPNGLIAMIGAGQPVKALYGGFNQADFAWLASQGTRDWSDLRDKSVGIGSYGDLTDFLTRYALRKHGLEPERDVQLVQVGGPANRLQALQSGKVEATLLTSPFKWQAAGSNLLGTQAEEVASAWPNNVYFAKESLLNERRETVRAVLRAHVKAIRLARADRATAVQALTSTLKLEQEDAERVYAETVAGFDERGELPAEAMPVFWEIAMASGEVTEPWPEARFFDRRFVDTFDAWAPK